MERYVLEALQKAVAAAVVPSDLPVTSVKCVGRNCKIPTDDKWLEVLYITNNPTGETYGSSKTYRGVLRLILHWPMKDHGAYSAMDLMKVILDGMPKGSKHEDLLGNVKVNITDTPNILNILEESPEMLIIGSIRYNFFNP